MTNSFLLTDKESVMQNLKNIHAENTGGHRERVNGLMAADYVDCDIESLTVTAEYQVLPWELNRKDVLHGSYMHHARSHCSDCCNFLFQLMVSYSGYGYKIYQFRAS